MVTFVDNHLDSYLPFIEQKCVEPAILYDLVQKLKNGDYVGQERTDMGLKLLGSTQMLMLEWTAQRPHLFPDLYIDGTTPEQASRMFE